jgi:hypothetical protein
LLKIVLWCIIYTKTEIKLQFERVLLYKLEPEFLLRKEYFWKKKGEDRKNRLEGDNKKYSSKK